MGVIGYTIGAGLNLPQQFSPLFLSLCHLSMEMLFFNSKFFHRPYLTGGMRWELYQLNLAYSSVVGSKDFIMPFREKSYFKIMISSLWRERGVPGHILTRISLKWLLVSRYWRNTAWDAIALAEHSIKKKPFIRQVVQKLHSSIVSRILSCIGVRMKRITMQSCSQHE